MGARRKARAGEVEETTRLDGTRTRRGTVASARDEELFVRCRSCGWPIASGIREPRGAKEERRRPSLQHRCPRCGAAATYAAADYAHRA